jgi:hypothetical protein
VGLLDYWISGLLDCWDAETDGGCSLWRGRAFHGIEHRVFFFWMSVEGTIIIFNWHKRCETTTHSFGLVLLRFGTMVLSSCYRRLKGGRRESGFVLLEMDDTGWVGLGLIGLDWIGYGREKERRKHRHFVRSGREREKPGSPNTEEEEECPSRLPLS